MKGFYPAVVISGFTYAVSCLKPTYQNQQHQHELSFFDLPGHAEPHETCGQWTTIVSCPENQKQTTLDSHGFHHDYFAVQRSCHRLVCSICYEDAAKRSGLTVQERLLGGVQAYIDIGINLGIIKHVIFSPKQDWAKEKLLSGSKNDFIKLRAKGYEMAQKAGIKGGAVVFHPYRFNNDNKPDDEGYHPELPLGPYLSPHFHVFGVGWLTKSDKFYEATEWVYKNKGSRKSISASVFYALTHCGISTQFKHETVTWFGVFAYNKLLCEKTKVEASIRCGVCNQELHEYEMILGQDSQGNEQIMADWKNDKGVYRKWIIKRWYYVKGHYPDEGYDMVIDALIDAFTSEEL